MEQTPSALAADAPNPLRSFGLWAVLLGALALALVFFQISLPRFEPHPSAAERVGEIAGEIRQSAWRTFLGLPKPEPKDAPVSTIGTIVTYLSVAAPLLGIVAIVLSLISGVLRENWRYSVYGVSLGAVAIVFQYVWWLALLVAGVVLLVSIIANIGDIFGL